MGIQGELVPTRLPPLKLPDLDSRRNPQPSQGSVGLQIDVSPRPPRSSSLGGCSQVGGGLRWPPLTEELQASGWTTGQSGIKPGSLCWLSLEQRGRGSLTFLCLSLSACLYINISLQHCWCLCSNNPISSQTTSQALKAS